jgi:NAD-dependent deacetylase
VSTCVERSTYPGVYLTTRADIAQIEESCRGREPNAGHKAIQKLAASGRFDVWILTQNVDGLHQSAGSDSERVIEIHGNVHGLECTICPFEQNVSTYEGLTYNKLGALDESIYPRCPECHNLLRPKVVLFGEGLDMDKVARLESEMKKSFSAVFSVVSQ